MTSPALLVMNSDWLAIETRAQAPNHKRHPANNSEDFMVANLELMQPFGKRFSDSLQLGSKQVSRESHLGPQQNFACNRETTRYVALEAPPGLDTGVALVFASAAAFAFASASAFALASALAFSAASRSSTSFASVGWILW